MTGRIFPVPMVTPLVCRPWSHQCQCFLDSRLDLRARCASLLVCLLYPTCEATDAGDGIQSKAEQAGSAIPQDASLCSLLGCLLQCDCFVQVKEETGTIPDCLVEHLQGPLLCVPAAGSVPPLATPHWAFNQEHGLPSEHMRVYQLLSWQADMSHPSGIGVRASESID